MGLMLNGNVVVSAYASGDTYDTGGNLVVLHLNVGDQLWLAFRNDDMVYSDASKFTTFSGFILYPDRLI